MKKGRFTKHQIVSALKKQVYPSKTSAEN